jgi:5-dehydro-2-deoxygluconokinase
MMAIGWNRTRPLGAIVVGRAGMDLYPEPDGTSIEAATRFVSDVGGSAGNIAVALARQGVAVALASALSDDAVGRFVQRTLAGYGVDVSHCRTVGGDRRTSLALAETRAVDCEVVIYRNQAADFAITAADLDETFLAEASVLIVTGTALAADPSRTAAMEALRLARKTKTFTMLDIDHRPYSWASAAEAGQAYEAAARHADAVIGNEDEFDILAGAAGGGRLAAEALLSQGGAFAILKHGERGSSTLTVAGGFETAAFSVRALKPFGAGDAFIGGVVAGLLAGLPLADAVLSGSAAAALVVSRRGCASAMPTAAEIAAIMTASATGSSHARSTL